MKGWTAGDLLIREDVVAQLALLMLVSVLSPAGTGDSKWNAFPELSS